MTSIPVTLAEIDAKVEALKSRYREDVSINEGPIRYYTSHIHEAIDRANAIYAPMRGELTAKDAEIEKWRAEVRSCLDDVLRRKAENDRLRAALARLQAHLGCDEETIMIGLDEARADINSALEPLSPTPVVEGDALPADVRRLVIAAREVAYEDRPDKEVLRELDQAAEAFAERVPWDDEPAPTDPISEEGECPACHQSLGLAGLPASEVAEIEEILGAAPPAPAHNAVLEGTLDRLHKAIISLSQYEGKITLFEASPRKSKAAFEAWQELNDAQGQAKRVLGHTFKLLFSKEWLREKITADPDVETEAGMPLNPARGGDRG